MPDGLTPTVRRPLLASAAAAAILLYLVASSIAVLARDAFPALTIVAQADPKPVVDPGPAPDAKTGTGADTPRMPNQDAKARNGADTPRAPKQDANARNGADTARMPNQDAKARNGADTRRRLEITIDEDEPTDRGKRRKIVAMGDREFESFEAMMQQAPWIAEMVVLIVSVVFLVPVLLVALFIWYRLRKNRMLNETMIKLAERGVVAPADVLDALTSNRQATAMGAATAATTAPLVERARLLRKGAAWSDLRKGVIMTAVGLGLSFYFLFDEGSVSWLGLVLLFVGIGYCVLWYFEDQQIARTRDSGVPPAGGA